MTRLPSGLKIAFHTLSVWPPKRSDRLPGDTVPQPDRLVLGRRDDAPTVQAERDRSDRILVALHVGDPPARRRIPQAYGIVRIHTSRNQPRPVGTEGQGPCVLDIAAQDGDLLAGYRIP